MDIDRRDTCIERVVQRRSEVAEIRGNDWVGNVSNYEVARRQVEVKDEWRMVMGIWNEEMEVWARKVCFSIDVRSNHFVQIGIGTLARERILGTLNQRRKPRFCREISPPFLKTVIMISFMSIHIVGASYEIICLWGWGEGDGL